MKNDLEFESDWFELSVGLSTVLQPIQSRYSILAIEMSSILVKLGEMVATSDHSSVVSMNLFVALLCACIVIGHLLEENRWMNESITALAIVSLLCVYPNLCTLWFTCILLYAYMSVSIELESWKWPFMNWWQGLCTGVVILLTSGGKSSHLLVFSEDLFFIYLLPPIIFNAGYVHSEFVSHLFMIVLNR